MYRCNSQWCYTCLCLIYNQAAAYYIVLPKLINVVPFKILVCVKSNYTSNKHDFLLILFYERKTMAISTAIGLLFVGLILALHLLRREEGRGGGKEGGGRDHYGFS